MKFLASLILGAISCFPAAAQPQIASFARDGALVVSDAFTNGVCTVEQAGQITGPWLPVKNIFTTNAVAQVALAPPLATTFYRALAVDLSGGRAGFTNLTHSYGVLTTIAGAGGTTAEINKWQSAFEGGPATNALLSRPHIAMADRAGNIYIADKDAHAVRQARPNGTIHTVVGINAAGDGPDEPTDATEVALNEPNGLWVRADGTVYILDLQNGKVRRRDPTGLCRTFFTVTGGIAVGRGLWVSEDESLAYFASGTVVKKWTPAEGVTDYATGFTELGNLIMDPWGKLVVTDRFSHRVYRIAEDGTPTVIAGASSTGPNGGDGGLATETVLDQVRGVWFLPTGGYFVCTHRSSQVWYVDTGGRIHLFLNGAPIDAHAGDGTWFYAPQEYRISECRAITMDHEGNLLLTEHDAGYVRKVRFLPFAP